MSGTIRIGLIGDYSPTVRAHQAIPLALERAAHALAVHVEPDWLPTQALAAHGTASLAAYDAFWCVPGSPYASMEGALAAICYARETGRPFLGTCGGFQHAVIEYARAVLGLEGADHAEEHPDAAMLLMVPLTCSLVGTTGTVLLAAGSRARAIYGAAQAEERYHCNFGLNPAYRAAFAGSGLTFSGVDTEGEVRVAELDGHPFFFATLFQPELRALDGRGHPLIHAYVQAAARAAEKAEAAMP